ncbi:MAG: trypsin-like peptidase domain-containing protein, partial [Thermoanaerobaculia bacterium]
MSDPFPPDTKRCPFCAEEILADASKCRHCGEWLVPPPPGRGPSVEGRRYSDAQPIWQLVLLWVSTFGFYGIRWFYRTWKQLKRDRDLDMSPGLHTLGLFVPILNLVLVFNLFKEIKEYAEDARIIVRWAPGPLVAAFVGLNLLWKLPPPWWAFSLLSVCLLAAAQATLNRYWSVRQAGVPVRRRMSGGQFAAVVVGGFCFLLVGLGVYTQLTQEAQELVSRARTSAASPAVETASRETSAPEGLPRELVHGQRAAAARLPGRKLSAQELFRLVSPALFVVTTRDSRGAVRTLGSAVSIARELAVTNAHVVEGGGSIHVTQGERSWSASVLDRDRERDLCRLRIEGIVASAALVRDPGSLRIGQRVYAVGAPEGLEMTLSEGLISGFRDFRGQRVVQTSAPISRGSSGGGLFDEMGALVGITTFMLAGGQNLNFAILADRALAPGIRPLSADELLAIW